MPHPIMTPEEVDKVREKAHHYTNLYQLHKAAVKVHRTTIISFTLPTHGATDLDEVNHVLNQLVEHVRSADRCDREVARLTAMLEEDMSIRLDI